MAIEATLKALDSMNAGETTYRLTEIEQYSQTIYSRVSEIDNALKSMSLSLEYMSQKSYPNSSYSFSEHHAFHVENFLLRLTSVVDRCYLLAGSTILMSNKKIEKSLANIAIKKELAKHSTKSVFILKKMDQKIKRLKKQRNKVAHQEGFSSKNLSVIQALEVSSPEDAKKITDIVSLDKIKKIVIEDSYDAFQKMITEINQLVKDLINSLSSIYTHLLKSTQQT